MSTPNTPADLLRQMVEEALRNPNQFAVASKDIPLPLLAAVDTLLIVTLIHLTSLQDKRISSLEAQLSQYKPHAQD